MKTYCRGLKPSRKLVAAAFDAWAGGDSGKKNRWRVDADYGGADALIDEVYAQWADRTLSFPPIRYYEAVDGCNGKVRTIAVQSVKQQVVDYLFALCAEGLFEAKRGYYQVAAVRGKGQLFGRRRAAPWVDRCRYAVKGDVRKCYESVDHGVLMGLLRRYVASDDVLYLAETLLATYRRGLNIGSYFSLVTMTFVLSFAYHEVESMRKVRRGVSRPLAAHQIWHMDDVMLLGDDKRDLRRAMRALGRYMRDELGLELKPWKVVDLRREPVTMFGYTFRKGRVTLAAGTFLRARRCVARFLHKRSLPLARRLCAYWGWLRNSACRGFMARSGAWKAMRAARAAVSAHDRKAVSAWAA